MAEKIKSVSGKVGLPPGTLVHIGEKKDEEVRIRTIEYNEEQFLERELSDIDDFSPPGDASVITWLNVDGLHRTDVIEKIGKLYGLHPLTLEDVLNTGQHPKMEDYREYLFIVLKMLYYNAQTTEIEEEQVSLCLGPNFVVSFQEEAGRDVFESVRSRIRNGKGKMRTMGADYLTYALIDAIIDSYFIILEKLGENIESLEEKVVTEPTEQVLREIHRLKREMIFLRKSVWPVREIISGMERGDSQLVRDAMHVYLRDVYDHTIRIIETIEADRDILSGVLDIYLSSISNRINAVMKVLTVIATIFMPLTFIAGVYGMNFKNMPELEWRWGYPSVLLFIAAYQRLDALLLPEKEMAVMKRLGEDCKKEGCLRFFIITSIFSSSWRCRSAVCTDKRTHRRSGSKIYTPGDRPSCTRQKTPIRCPAPCRAS